MSDLPQELESLNLRVTSLEERLTTIQGQIRRTLDLYRSLQIDDEGQIRKLYDDVQKIKQQLGMLQE